MTQQIIDIGDAPNDGTGDPFRTSFDKANQNFAELYKSAGTASEGLWNYHQTSTDTSTSPVSGRFRTNSGNYLDATQIAIHGITIQGIDRAYMLRTQLAGDIIKCQDSLNADAWCRYILQSPPIDNGTWFQLNVALKASGDVPSGDNQEIVFIFTANSAIRERLTAHREYFVRTDGSDSNNGLSNTAGGAFLTIQKAVDVASGTLDLNAYQVNIYVADGTYGPVQCKSYVGKGPITILGNATTPANCIISATNAFPIYAPGVLGGYYVIGFHLKSNTSGYDCVLAAQGSQVTLRNIRFESPAAHVHATFHSRILVDTDISIVGNFNIHAFPDSQSIIQEVALTITIAGTPNIGQAWAWITQGSTFISNANTYNGSCTGMRYYVASQSYCNTGTSGSAGYFPGSVNGSVATGGIYD